MNNETEQKKEYMIPAMEVVEFKHRGQLLEASPSNPLTTHSELL